MKTVPETVTQHNGLHREAPVSMNAFVDVEGAGRVQVTARGATGLEAATNLRHSVASLRDTFAPAPQPSREERLSQLLTCGTMKAITRGDLALVERLTKAFVMVVKGMVEPASRAGVYAVRSMAAGQSETWYEVEPVNEAGYKACTCPDWKRHRDDAGHYACKHVLATLFLDRLNN